MPGMTRMEIKKLVNRYIGVSNGYLGDFSYRSHADFYVEFCDLDIDPNRFNGTTRERFETILETATPEVQAKIIRGILEKYPPDKTDLKRLGLRDEFLELSARLEQPSVAFVATIVTSQVVERAISDAETLIRSRGATSGVDRIHTALHGYLRQVCDDNSIRYEEGASMTVLFKKLRSDHLAFKSDGPREQNITQVVRAMSAIMDALNPIRNNASVAHPNEVLLGEPEAMLVINATRTLLHYIDAKIAKHNTDRKDVGNGAVPSVAIESDDLPF